MAGDHPTQRALGHIETASILAELAISRLHSRRLGGVGQVMHRGRPGVLFRVAEGAVSTGVASRLASRWGGPRVRDAASGLFLAGALTFRYAWVQAGQASARDDATVSAGARRPPQTPTPALSRHPGRGGPWRAWSEAIRRVSLAVEGVLRTGAPRTPSL